MALKPPSGLSNARYTQLNTSPCRSPRQWPLSAASRVCPNRGSSHARRNFSRLSFASPTASPHKSKPLAAAGGARLALAKIGTLSQMVHYCILELVSPIAKERGYGRFVQILPQGPSRKTIGPLPSTRIRKGELLRKTGSKRILPLTSVPNWK